MTVRTSFKKKEDAYESLKRSLMEKDYSVGEPQPIDYGIQFIVEKNNYNDLIRIYHSKKKGIKIDYSQVKSNSIKDDINHILNLCPDGIVSSPQDYNSKIYSLNVGLNKFKIDGFGDLDFAENDASALHQKIRDKFGFGDGTYCLTNEDATRKRIISKIKKIAEIARPEDTVFMSFSTHGDVILNKEEKPDFYIITSDSSSDNLAESSLPMRILKSEISKIKSDRKIIFLDTCYSGGISRNRNPEKASNKDAIFKKFVESDSQEFIMIAASKTHQSSWECNNLKHGVFTHFLLNGLSGCVESKNGLVEATTLYAYLHNSVSEYVKKKFSSDQHPKFYGNFTGNFKIPLLIETDDADSDSTNQKKPFSFERAKCIGIDESGKGDYFGPLAVAAVYVDTEEKASELISIGVKDSKKLSDKRIRILAEKIKSLCDHKTLHINPERYNELWNKMGNLNYVLAWSHAQCLESVLTKNKECKLAISDKFASKHVLMKRLKSFGKAIELIQRPKAEENISVAAASILARDRYLNIMERMERDYKHKFIRGADQKVVKSAAIWLMMGGELQNVAKVNFKTTNAVLKEHEKMKKL